MSMPLFQKCMATFPDPWKTLIQLVDEQFHLNQLENFVILGKYVGDEQVYINAFSIVGLAPGYRCFLECHFTNGKEMDKPFWVSELRDVIPALTTPENSDVQRVNLIGGIIHSKLGLDKCHSVGMISLHQTIKSKKSFVVLWKNSQIERYLVEEIMRHVLNERLVIL